MKNKKFEINIIIGLLILSIILLGISLIYNKYRKENTYNIFLSYNNYIKCYKYTCEDDTFINDSYYKVYIAGEYKGLNKVKYNTNNDKLYIFNSNSNNIYKDKSKRIFIYTGDTNIKQIDFTTEEVTTNEVNLISNSIDYDISNYTFAYKVVKDFDNDKENEKIIIITNENQAYILVVYIDKDKVNIIENITDEETTNIPSIYVNNIIDIYNDGKFELILSKGYYDNIGSCKVIYRLKNNKYVSINECKLTNN